MDHFCERCESELVSEQAVCDVCGHAPTDAEGAPDAEPSFTLRFRGTEFGALPIEATAVARVGRRSPAQLRLVMLVVVVALYGAIGAISMELGSRDEPAHPLTRGLHHRP
jgi:hypothetical protein